MKSEIRKIALSRLLEKYKFCSCSRKALLRAAYEKIERKSQFMDMPTRWDHPSAMQMVVPADSRDFERPRFPSYIVTLPPASGKDVNHVDVNDGWWEGIKDTVTGWFSDETEEKVLLKQPSAQQPDMQEKDEPEAKPKAPEPKKPELSQLTPKEFSKYLGKIPPGKNREDFIVNSVLKNKAIRDQVQRQLKEQLVPVTTKGPGGSEITYHVTPDFLYIDTPDGRKRLQLSGVTAEKIGQEFDMEIPTDKMVDDIWEKARKLQPKPLSGSGVTIDGQRYSAQDVVSKTKDGYPIMMHPDAIDQYNRTINQQVGSGNDLVAGHMKTVTKQHATDSPNKLRLSGWKTPQGQPLQPSMQTYHDTDMYYDYSHGARYASKKVTVKYPDGTVKETTLKDLLNNPKMYAAISRVPGYTQYGESQSAPSPAPPRMVSQRSVMPRGPEIRRMQGALRKLDADSSRGLVVDGIWGPITSKAVNLANNKFNLSLDISPSIENARKNSNKIDKHLQDARANNV